ncbi:AI-2E family transporter [Oceanobacillus bengalensis]|uniref:AI-2E family transporter n=1 Tax=Oceanobacillus bengalensis TaxID=1435466 RepID=UPI001FE39E0B|nr:AI-2E family transporter [Oceanobacillus bengalensis]
MFRNEKRLNFIYWILIGILLFLFIYLLVKTFPFYGVIFSFLWKFFTPFLIAGLIAYLLYPIVEKLHSYRIHRGLAILFIYLLFFGGIGYLVYRVYPQVVHQVRDLTNNFPEFMSLYQNSIHHLYEYTSFLPETVHDKMDQVIFRIEHSLDALLSKLVNGFTRIFDMVVIITVIPVLVFYFLKDYDKIKGFFKKFVPSNYQKKTSEVIHAIDDSLGKYIRGQLLVCLFVGLTSLLIFKFLDLEYALILAIGMAVTNIIPYFGPILGAVPAVIIAFTTTGQIKLVIFVIIGIFIIQIIEGNLLSPYIVGKSVAIHPVAIIIALLLGGQLFGVLGMIMAVPVLTIVRVIVKHIWQIPANH